jgi:hypothetical protein
VLLTQKEGLSTSCTQLYAILEENTSENVGVAQQLHGGDTGEHGCQLLLNDLEACQGLAKLDTLSGIVEGDLIDRN